MDQLKNGPPRRRVGLIVEEAPACRPSPLNLRLFVLEFGLFYFRGREGAFTKNFRRDWYVPLPW
jgi:hypothetical protein